MLQATKDNFASLTQNGVVLVDFYADWCGPCRALTPILEQLQGVTVVKVNVDQEQELALRHGVSSIPHMVLMKDGQAVSNMVGLRNQADLQEQVNAARTSTNALGKSSVHDDDGKKIGEEG